MKRNPLQRVLRAAARALAGLALLPLLLLVAVQVDAVGTWAVRTGARAVAPSGITVDVDRVSGSWIRSLTLEGIRVADTRGGPGLRLDTLSLDTLRLRFNLLSLRPDRVPVDSIHIRGLRAGVTLADSSAEARADTGDAGGRLQFLANAVDLHRGSLTIRIPGRGRFAADSLHAAMRNLVTAPTPRVSSWELATVFSPSGTPGDWGRLMGSGGFDGTAIRLDTLDLRSPRSRVSGAGWVPLDGTLLQPGRLRWRVEASPLALADLQGLLDVPAVVEEEVLTLATRAEPVGDSARMTLALESRHDGRMDVSAHWGGGEGTWGGRFETRVQDLALRRFLGDGFPEAPLHLEATGTAEAAAPDGSLQRARIRSTLEAQSGPTARIRGAVELVRRVQTGGDPVDSLRLSLDALRWETLALERGEARVDRTGPSLAWSLRLEPGDGGVLAGRGTLESVGTGAPLVHRETLTLDSVVDPYSGSVLTGDVELRGQGTDPMNSRLEGVVRLGPSRVGPVQADSTRLGLRWEAGRGSVEGGTEGPRGTLRLGARLALDQASGRLVVDSLVADSLLPVPGDAVGEPMQRVRTAGRLSGVVQWEGSPAAAVDPRSLRADLLLETGATVAGAVTLDSARTTFRWNAGALDAETRARVGDSGVVEATVEGTVLDSLRLDLTRGRFQDLDLSALLLSGGPGTGLTGGVAGGWAIPPGDSVPLASIRLTLEPSRVSGDSVQAADLRTRLSRDSLTGIFQVQVAGGQAGGRFEAPRPPFDVADLKGDLTVDLPALGSFFGKTDTAVALQGTAWLGPTPAPEDAGGAGRDVDPGEVSAHVRVARARGWGVQLDTLVLDGRLTEHVARVDTLFLRSNLVTVDGGGELPASLIVAPDSLDTVPVTAGSRRRFGLRAILADSVETLELDGIGRLMARSGSLSVATACDAGSCRLQGNGLVGSLLLGSNSVASVDLEVDGALEPGPWVSELDARARILGVRTPTADIRDVRLDASLSEGVLSADARTTIDDRRDAELGVVARLGRERGEVTVRNIRFRMDEDRWSLQRPATVRYGGEGITVDTLSVAAGDQSVRVAGTWSGPRGHAFTVRLDSVRIGTVSDLLGARGLDGWISASVAGYGSEPIPDLEATGRGALSYRNRPLHSLRLQADKAGGVLAVDGYLRDEGDRPRLRVAGEIPLSEADDGWWNLDVSADSVPLNWLDPYLREEVVRIRDGSADARIALRGPRTTPTAEGPLEIRGGRITLPTLGITLSETRLRSTLSRRTLRIDTLSARSGGRARVSGTLTLPSAQAPPEVSLDLRARDFLAMDTRMLRAVANADVTLEGTGDAPRVEGSVEVLEGNVNLDEGLGGGAVEDVALTEEDWAMLQSRFGIVPPDEDLGTGPPLFRATELDIAVTLGRNTWLRQSVNPQMAVQFTGDMAVAKAAGQEAVDLQGELEAIPRRSYLEQFGRRFQLEQGIVRLRGAPEETEVDITSVYEVPPRDGGASQVSIRLGLSGTVGALRLELSSQPSMENADIVSYLATGRPAADAFSGGGSGTSATDIGTDVVASQLTGLVEEFAMRDVGLDVVEIERDGLRGATLIAGQYVTPALFLGFRQPVSFGQSESAEAGAGATEAEVEWRAFRWLLLHLETGGNAFRFFLEGSIGY